MRRLAFLVIAGTSLVGCGGQTSSTEAGNAGVSGAGGAGGIAATGGVGGVGGAIGGSSGAIGGSGGVGGSIAGNSGVAGSTTSGGAAGIDAGVPDASPACVGGSCMLRTCQGKVYACGDCIDNDGDGLVDSEDPDCLGACDNNEGALGHDLPGQNPPACVADCYFDQDYGPGNDECVWSHHCDPHAVPPDYPPEGMECAYNPDASVPWTYASCAALMVSQSAACTTFCGPITPNGCDCFGCCKVPQAPTPIWLGSEESGSDNPTCTTSTLADPKLCKPCTIVPSCFNPCAECELCLGKTSLPASCNVQECPSGAQPCGLPGQGCCPAGSYCVSGCCQKVQ